MPYAEVTSTPSVIVDESVSDFTAASNDPVILGYGAGPSSTVPPDTWFERPQGDAVNRSLLGPGFVWAYIVRTDRTKEGSRTIASIQLPVQTW